MNYALAVEVSSVFNVSFEAATYRLKQLGHISQDAYLSSDGLNLISSALFACNF